MKNPTTHNSRMPGSYLMALAAMVIVLAGIIAAKAVIIPVLLAVFISIICAPPIQFLDQRKVPHGISVILVILLILMIFIFLGGIIGNSLAGFTQNLPSYEENLREVAGDIFDTLEKFGIAYNSDELLELIDFRKALNFTAVVVNELGKIVSDSFIILLIAVFFLLELQSLSLKANFALSTFNKSSSYLSSIIKSVRHYISIKSLTSLLTGVLITIWLLVVGVDYPILWGLIAFLLNYIPSIGSIIAAIPTVLLALVQLGPGGMLWTGIGYLLINFIVGNILEPKIMGDGLGLSPLVVFLSLIVWGFVLGTMGMFLSIPITMSVKIMLEQDERTSWIAVLLGTKSEIPDIGDMKTRQND